MVSLRRISSVLILLLCIVSVVSYAQRTPFGFFAKTAQNTDTTFVMNYFPSVNNGGFETLGGDYIWDSWIYYKSSEGCSLADTNHSRHGNRACRIYLAGDDDIVGPIHTSTIEVGKQYTVRFYAKRLGSGGTPYAIIAIGGNDWHYINLANMGSSWYPITATSTEPTEDTDLKIYMNNKSDTYIIDDIRVIELADDTNWYTVGQFVVIGELFYKTQPSMDSLRSLGFKGRPSGTWATSAGSYVGNGPYEDNLTGGTPPVQYALLETWADSMATLDATEDSLYYNIVLVDVEYLDTRWSTLGFGGTTMDTVRMNAETLAAWIDYMKVIQPSLRFGYYSCVPNNQPGLDSTDENWRLNNDTLGVLVDAVDFLSPSVYIQGGGYDWNDYIPAIIAEARRIAPNKPIFPYVSPVNRTTYEFADSADWFALLNLVKSCGANGVVLWEGGNDLYGTGMGNEYVPYETIVTMGWWKATLAFMQENATDTTRWYVSNSGSDDNDGHSVTYPLQTISALNAKTLEAGDVVSFNRGDTFVGQITAGQSGSVGNPITYTAYGEGETPIISGAERLQGWVARGNFYATKATGDVKALFAGGVRQKLARKPNSGTYTISAVDGSDFRSTSIGEASGYWTGAKAVIKPTVYIWFSGTITAYDGTDLTVQNAHTIHAPAVNNPFYMEAGPYMIQALALLDTVGEWYCNFATDSVYYYGDTSAVIIGSTYEHGFYASSKDYLVVSDLDFRYGYYSGVLFAGDCANILIDNNNVSNTGVVGIRNTATGSDSIKSLVVSNNVIADIPNGIKIGNAPIDTIRDNQLNRIGIATSFIGDSAGYDGYMGISIGDAPASCVQYNTMDSIGYMGIRADMPYGVVEYNYVRNAVLKLNDGGGIYCYSDIGTDTARNHYLTIRKNIVVDSKGVDAETGTDNTAMDIYLDGFSRHITVDSNTVINNYAYAGESHAIFTQLYSYHNTLTNNLIWSPRNKLTIIYDTLYSANHPVGSHIISGNTMVGTGNSLVYRINNVNWRSFGTSDENLAVNKSYVVHYQHRTSTGGEFENNYYTTWSSWNAVSGTDASSTTDVLNADTVYYNPTKLTVGIKLVGAHYTIGDDSTPDYADGDTLWLSPYSSIALGKASKYILVDYSPVIRNGDLEDVDGDTFNEFSLYDGGSTTSAGDTSEARSGSHAIVVYHWGEGYCGPIPDISVSSGKTYKISWYAKSSQSTDYYFFMEIGGAQSYEGYTLNTSTWTLCSYQAEATGDGIVKIFNYFPESNGVVLIDDIKLEEIP